MIDVGVGDVTYNFESVGNDAHSHQLLSVVAAVHHQGVGQALNDGALCLAETLDSVFACRVGEIDWCSDVDVVAVWIAEMSVFEFFARF